MDTSKEQEILNWDLSPLEKSIVGYVLSTHPRIYDAGDRRLYDEASIINQGFMPDDQARDLVKDGFWSVVYEIKANFPNDGSDQEREAFLWNLWEFIIRLAQSLSEDGNVHLTSIIHGLSLMKQGEITVWGTKYFLWRDLPLLGPCMREAWIDPTFVDDLKSDAEELTRWRNLNFFAAYLLDRRVVNWANMGLWQLRTGFEEPGEFDVTRLLVASGWIRVARLPILKLCILETDVDDKALAPGPEFDGRPGFSRRRWTFWMTRLRDAYGRSTNADVREDLAATLRDIENFGTTFASG